MLSSACDRVIQILADDGFRAAAFVAVLATLSMLGCGEAPTALGSTAHSLATTGGTDGGNELSEYARQCDEVIRRENGDPATVPEFDCEAGTVVDTDSPNQNFHNGVAMNETMKGGIRCDYPNRLNNECDPGSKFLTLVDDPDAVVVAHCRKQQYKRHLAANGTLEHHAPGDGYFGDIATLGDLELT